jgi:hypothetical protein
VTDAARLSTVHDTTHGDGVTDGSATDGVTDGSVTDGVTDGSVTDGSVTDGVTAPARDVLACLDGAGVLATDVFVR